MVDWPFPKYYFIECIHGMAWAIGLILHTMNKFTIKVRNQWIFTAAEEIREIQIRWKLLSCRQFSRKLHINARTLSKLNPRCPDGTLRLETLDRIYSILIALLRSEFCELEKMKEEYHLLIESRVRIMQSVSPLPPAIVALVLDELEHQ